MKVLVMSDMHGRVNNFEKALEKQGDAVNVVFLGDGLSKAEELSFCYNDRRFFMVPGNCDLFDFDTPTTKFFEINGAKIMATHGHSYSVKSSLTMLKQKAVSEGVDICLYGHTHNADILYENGIYFVNPGTLAGKNGFYSYAVIDITDKGILPSIVEI